MIELETGLWNRLERFSVPDGVMATWKIELGDELELARPFFRPTGAKAEWYPCTRKSDCGCSHEVFEGYQGILEAVCRCDEPDCDTIILQPEDLIIYGLDMRKVCEAIRNAFGFAGPENETGTTERFPHHWAVGTCGAFKSAVYLAMRLTEQEFISEIEKIANEHPDPFVLLAPSNMHYSSLVHSMLHRNKCEFIDLSKTLAFDGPGRFKVKESVEAILRRFEERLSNGPQAGKLLAEIHQEIAGVRKDFHALRTVKERLEKMQAEKLFAFTEKIDPDSFRTLCSILANGDVAKASRALNVSDSTLRSRIADWENRGATYKVLIELVRWRKNMGPKGTIPLKESIIKAEAPSTDYSGLLSDVLDGILSMDEESWAEKAEELADLLRPYVVRC